MKIIKEAMRVQYNEHMRGGEGTVTLLHLQEGENLPPHCRLHAQITVPAGASIGYHVHEGETEVFHFLSGRGHVDDNGTKVPVEAGDVISTPSGCGHAVYADEGVDLVMDAVINLKE